MVQSYTIDVVLPPGVIERVHQFRQKCVPHEKGPRYTPRLGLQEEFRTRSISGVMHGIEGIASEVRPFKVNFSKPEVVDESDLVMAVEKTAPIDRIHNALIEMVSQFRTPHKHMMYAHFYRETDISQPLVYGNLMKYGMPFAGELFKPGILVAPKVGNENISKVKEEASGLRLQGFTAEQLVLVCYDSALKKRYVCDVYNLGEKIEKQIPERFRKR